MFEISIVDFFTKSTNNRKLKSSIGTSLNYKKIVNLLYKKKQVRQPALCYVFTLINQIKNVYYKKITTVDELHSSGTQILILQLVSVAYQQFTEYHVVFVAF